MPDFRQFLVLGALALVGLMPMPGHAAELPRPTPIDARFDIMGIRIGQTAAEVHAVLAKADPESQLQEGKTKSEGNLEDYVNQIVFRSTKKDPKDPGQVDVVDTVRVLFSAPASGNRSLAVERSVYYYNNSNPIMFTTVEALEKKYGISPELKTRGFTPFNKYEKLVFDETGKVRSQSPLYNVSNCGFGSTNENIGSFSSACRSAILSWDVEPALDHDRVDRMFVLLKDHDFALAALKVDKEAAQEAHNAEITRLRAGAAAAPRL